MSTYACMHTVGDDSIWRRLATIQGFSPLHRRPLARPGLERGHILQGVSKQRWHVDVLARAEPSTPHHHRISRPCQESSRSCFLSSLFSSLSLWKKKLWSAKENRVIVSLNGCSIPQVYPDLKIPIKRREGFTTGKMLMVILVSCCSIASGVFLSSLIKQYFSWLRCLCECTPVT